MNFTLVEGKCLESLNIICKTLLFVNCILNLKQKIVKDWMLLQILNTFWQKQLKNTLVVRPAKTVLSSYWTIRTSFISIQNAPFLIWDRVWNPTFWQKQLKNTLVVRPAKTVLSSYWTISTFFISTPDRKIKTPW